MDETPDRLREKIEAMKKDRSYNNHAVTVVLVITTIR